MIQNQSDAIHALAKGGANLNKKDREGATPLMSAIRLNKSEAAAALVKAGADVNISQNVKLGDGKSLIKATPLNLAVFKKQPSSLVKLL